MRLAFTTGTLAMIAGAATAGAVQASTRNRRRRRKIAAIVALGGGVALLWEPWRR